MATAVTLGVAATPASAASTCAAHGIVVTPLQSPVFYIDTATSYLGSYVGFRITNSGASARDDVWDRLESFTGDVRPASGNATTSALPIGDLGPAGSAPGYAYLKATTETTTAQAYDVVVYAGRPGAGGSEICRETQTVPAVYDVIKAAANKVLDGAITPSSVTLGGTFQITVHGSTGTVGAGLALDPGIIRFSPAVAADWPATAFRLVAVSHRLPLGALPVADVLSRSSMSGPDAEYSVTYTFRAVGPTNGPTPVNPVQNIASGTQVKHTDPGTLSSLAPIPRVTSTTSVAVAAGGARPYATGATVPLTATFSNSGSNPVSIDEATFHLPTSWTPVGGTTKIDGAGAPDPYAAGGGAFQMPGPFTIPANGTLVFTFDATAGTAGDFVAAGTLVGGVVDATADPNDDVPATVSLPVLGAPVARDDSATVGASGGAVDVLANDDAASGSPALSVVAPPTHGTAVVSSGHVVYVPDAGYGGVDAFVYRLTTSGGTSDATVDVDVVPPPAAGTETSTGVGTDPQHATLTIPAGGHVTLLDAGGNPATTVTVPGEGTYVLDPATGAVTFTPVLGFAGQVLAVRYRVTDGYGQTADSTYTPDVTPPAAPAPLPQTSTGDEQQAQSVTVAVPAGGNAALLDDADQPVAQLAVDGIGTYAMDPSTGVITFTPEPTFSGTPRSVRYRVTDAYGQSREATYTPTVVAASTNPTPITTTTTTTTTPTPTPPPPTTTTTTTTTPPVPDAATPPTARPAQLVYAPVATTCVSRRAVRIHWKVRADAPISSITVRRLGLPTLRLGPTARAATIDLRGLGRARILVVVTAHVHGGGHLRALRAFRTCTSHVASTPATLTLA